MMVGVLEHDIDGNVRRAIDFAEGATVDGAALQALVREAVAVCEQVGRPVARPDDLPKLLDLPR